MIQDWDLRLVNNCYLWTSATVMVLWKPYRNVCDKMVAW